MIRKLLSRTAGLVAVLLCVGWGWQQVRKSQSRSVAKQVQQAFELGAGPDQVPRSVPVVTRLLQAGAAVESRSSWDMDLLMLAAYYGDDRGVEYLIRRGFDPNRHDKQGGTPLQYAAMAGQQRVAELLLAHGAKVHAVDNWVRTPLFEAATHERPAIARLLLDHGADANHRSRNGQTPLLRAVGSTYRSPAAVHVARVLLRYGADPNVRDDHGECPLNLAANYEFTPMVRLLKKAGARR